MIKLPKRIIEKEWMKFGRDLLQRYNSDALEEQIKFLQACRDGNKSFLDYLEPLLSNSNNLTGKDSSYVDIRLTEKEFRNPPEDTQEEIFDNFKDYPSETLSYNGFWAYLIINLIRNNAIQSSFLAANTGNNNQSGLTCLDYALNENADELLVDATVRRVLRSMCNPAPRGARRVFNDFVLGSSFWRWNFASRVSKSLEKNLELVLNTLSVDMFGQISDALYANDSWLSHKNVLSGVVLFREKYDSISVKSFMSYVKRLRYMSAWKAIEIQTPKDNFDDLVLIKAE